MIMRVAVGTTLHEWDGSFSNDFPLVGHVVVAIQNALKSGIYPMVEHGGIIIVHISLLDVSVSADTWHWSRAVKCPGPTWEHIYQLRQAPSFLWILLPGCQWCRTIGERFDSVGRRASAMFANQCSFRHKVLAVTGSQKLATSSAHWHRSNPTTQCGNRLFR